MRSESRTGEARPSKADVVTDFRRTQVLDAARACFGRHGLAGTTVDGIAREAGVAKGTVYLYYKSKDAILRQVLDDDLRQLHEETVPLITGPGSLDDRLRRFFAAVLALFERKRDFFEHAHFEMTPDVRKKALKQLEVVFKAQVSAWRTALADGRRRDVSPDLDVTTAALTIVGAASGLAKQRLRGWTKGPIDELAAQASATLLKGLTAR